MMRAPTISSDLKAADDLQEAISLIWMLDAGVRGLGLDLESPDGRAAPAWRTPSSLWSKSSREWASSWRHIGPGGTNEVPTSTPY